MEDMQDATVVPVSCLTELEVLANCHTAKIWYRAFSEVYWLTSWILKVVRSEVCHSSSTVKMSLGTFSCPLTVPVNRKMVIKTCHV